MSCQMFVAGRGEECGGWFDMCRDDEVDGDEADGSLYGMVIPECRRRLLGLFLVVNCGWGWEFEGVELEVGIAYYSID